MTSDLVKDRLAKLQQDEAGVTNPTDEDLSRVIGNDVDATISPDKYRVPPPGDILLAFEYEFWDGTSNDIGDEFLNRTRAELRLTPEGAELLAARLLALAAEVKAR